VGTPTAAASVRSIPLDPSLSMMTFEPNARASLATSSSDISARTWSIFVRPRVEVWKSRP
jgi:hypothetical protein